MKPDDARRIMARRTELEDLRRREVDLLERILRGAGSGPDVRGELARVRDRIRTLEAIALNHG